MGGGPPGRPPLLAVWLVDACEDDGAEDGVGVEKYFLRTGSYE